MTKLKAILIISFTIVLCIMTLGYAALKEQIDISGNTSIDSVYRVEISKIEQTSITGQAVTKEIPTYTELNANFSVGLTTLEDSITYNIEITNFGTVDVILNNVDINTESSNAIKVIKSGIRNGDILLASQSKVMTIEITLNSASETNEITDNVHLNLEYTRLKGGTGQIVKDNYYSIGDKVTFAGNDWYAIEESPEEQDYITLLKGTRLTAAELGEYAGKENLAIMAYYYSDTCHYTGRYGYTDTDSSGCEGHNDYEGSKVKEMLENQYLLTLGNDNLKEVDGYKIRLITKDEVTILQNQDNDLSAWLYGGNYWTMTPNSGNTSQVWRVASGGYLSSYIVYADYSVVRPVINLLKSSIR